MDELDVLVVGAGIAGLTAARRLAERGRRVAVVDKGRGVGGRLATRRIGEAPFDTGAQFFTARSQGFRAAVAGWAAAGVVREWSRGFPLWDARAGWRPDDDGHPRWCVPGGMTRLAKHLAADLDVRCDATVLRLDAAAGRWTAAIATPSGEQRLVARSLVATAPLPQVLALLDAGSQEHPLAGPLRSRLQAVRYDPCLCLLLDWPDAPGPLLPPPGAVRLPDAAESIAWLASQRAKGLRPAGEGVTLHARGAWSAERYGSPDADLEAQLIAAFRDLVARMPTLPGPWRAGVDPAATSLRKWRYSHVAAGLDEPCVRIDSGAPLVLAGDGCAGGRVEAAWLSGAAAGTAL